jgi:hypothetical protein
VDAQAEHLPKGSNPRFVVTSLPAARLDARTLYEGIYCARGQVESRRKEQQLDLFADRTSAATMRANQLRLWLASFAYVLLDALRRIGLRHTQFAVATCGTIRLKLWKIGFQVRISIRRIKVATASLAPIRPSTTSAAPLSEHTGIPTIPGAPRNLRSTGDPSSQPLSCAIRIRANGQTAAAPTRCENPG